jgi:DDE superfamily endonuclease
MFTSSCSHGRMVSLEVQLNRTNTEEHGDSAIMAITVGYVLKPKQRMTFCLLASTEKRLSQWIESFRKDVECVFGILKGRFRILKTGIRLDGPEAADNVWLTCCASHNLLLASAQSPTS